MPNPHSYHKLWSGNFWRTYWGRYRLSIASLKQWLRWASPKPAQDYLQWLPLEAEEGRFQGKQHSQIAQCTGLCISITIQAAAKRGINWLNIWDWHVTAKHLWRWETKRSTHLLNQWVSLKSMRVSHQTVWVFATAARHHKTDGKWGQLDGRRRVLRAAYQWTQERSGIRGFSQWIILLW